MDRAPLSIHLLGRFEVSVGGRPIPASDWHRRKSAELVELLALAPRHRIPKEQAVEALWPEVDPVTGGSRLRKAAHYARRTLGLDDGIVTAEDEILLAPGHRLRTDVHEFDALAADALRTADEAACRDAAARYGGELLPGDLYAAWSEPARARLRRLFLHVLAGGRLWGRLVAEDPADEHAHRELMRHQLAGGNRSAALRTFGELRVTLREELGVSPGRETVALYEEILAQEGAPAPTPAERARALLSWAAVHRERSDLAEAERAAVEVRALAVDAGLTAELAEAGELLGLLAYARGAWPEVFAREFLATVTGSPELAPFLFDANMCMSEFALGEADGPGMVSALAEQMLEEGRRLDSRRASALGHLLRGEARLLSGAEDAVVLTDLRAAESSWAAEETTGRALTAARLAQLSALQGRPDEADETHRQALALAHAGAVQEHLLPWIHGGMLETAATGRGREILTAAERDIGELRMCDPCAMALRVGAARVCAGTGEVAKGRAVLADAARVAPMWQGGPWHAAVLEARALLDRAEAPDRAGSEDLLARAAAGFTAAGRPREAARCRAESSIPPGPAAGER